MFKIGMRVRLRSGGPLMTVTGINEGKGVPCRWFNNTGTVCTGIFLEAELMSQEDLRGARET